MSTHPFQATVEDAERYWNQRVVPYKLRWFIVGVAFVVAEFLVAIFSSFLAVALPVALLAFVVGDMSTLKNVAQCRHCGILISAAPAFRALCPACGHFIGDGSAAL